MQGDIDEGKFVEWGEYEGHLYGTKIDSIRNVMRTGKMCILDLNPTVCFYFFLLASKNRNSYLPEVILKLDYMNKCFFK